MFENKISVSAIFSGHNRLLSIILIYLSLVLPILLKLSFTFSLLFLFIGFIYLIINSPSNVMLSPFIIYPFMFLLKHSESNIFISILPDVFCVLAVFFYFITSLYYRHTSNRFFKFTLIIFIHGFLTVLISSIHVNDLSFLPVILRQFFLPLIFLIVIVRFSILDNLFPIKALIVSLISFFIVSCFAIMNITQFISFNSTVPELFPLLIVDDIILTRSFFFSDLELPRMNLLLGGALGSSGAILMCLSIISFKIFSSKLIKYVFSIVFFVCALASGSNSVIIPIIIFLFLYFQAYKSFLSKYFFIIILLYFVTILFNSALFTDDSLLDYFTDSIVAVSLKYFNNLDYFSFLFGVGPRITSSGFEFLPQGDFVIDVGIFRVFIETGLLNFIIFLIPILFVIINGYKNLKKINNNIILLFLVLFYTTIFMVHANFSILPPFYPLFSLSVAGLLINNLNLKNK